MPPLEPDKLRADRQLRRIIELVISAILLNSSGAAQSTQGVLLGSVRDSISDLPLIGVQIQCKSEAGDLLLSTRTDDQGSYALVSLSPGRYLVTAVKEAYQSQQARELEIAVASRVELNFVLRPLADLWGTKQTANWQLPNSQQTLLFFGPDVDISRIVTFNANLGHTTPLETSRSDVILPTFINDLPLIGRDAYALLVLLPGVTADTTTGRGLGFSVNGQRPSASNYLLDGLDNNNSAVTGPLSTPVPEFIQEYRISSANYGAEYGGTGGFIANVATIRGGDYWHGKGFFYFENDRLNAADFQENANRLKKSPLTQVQPGGVLSGPLSRGRWYGALGFETLRSKARSDPQPFVLPTASYVRSLDRASLAGKVLNTYRPEVSPAGTANFALISIAPPADFNSSNGFARIDYVPANRATRLYARLARDTTYEPDLVFSPYRDFSDHYYQRSVSLGLDWNLAVGAHSMNELRGGVSGDLLSAQSNHSDLPQLNLNAVLLDDMVYRIRLPGAAVSYFYRNGGTNWQLADNFSRISGRHTWKTGGGWFSRYIGLSLGYIEQGSLIFDSLATFKAGVPHLYSNETDRFIPGYSPPDPNRSYRYRQAYLFAEDSFRVTSRLTLDFGLRYDYFGAPDNTGAVKDAVIHLGTGDNIVQTLGKALVVPGGGAGDQRLFQTTPNVWGVRAGAAFDLWGNGRTLVRASYGIFYDRLFDNLWESLIQNRYTSASFQYSSRIDFPLSAALEMQGAYQPSSQPLSGLVFQPVIRTPAVQSTFAGVQQKLAPGWLLEAYATASRGRQLITTDKINRPVPSGDLSVPTTPDFGLLDYRANQGWSNYTGMEGIVRFRRNTLSGQVSYTLSHSIDNQSEPLAGSFFELNLKSTAYKPAPSSSAFTTEFMSGQDKGNSDFDQRQNLLFFVVWSPESSVSNRLVRRALRGWTVGALGAVRSGLPFSVYAFETLGRNVPPVSLINERADLVNPAMVTVNLPGMGGRVILNQAAFAPPKLNAVGTSGRNEFTGPGLVSADLSVSRAFPVSKQTERVRLVLRCDFYNVLNHTNLNNPNSLFGDPNFGLAFYGRSEYGNGFPLAAPLNETARHLQLMMRVEF